MSSAICFSLDQSKTLSSGNGLKAKRFRPNPKVELFLDFEKVGPKQKGSDDGQP